MASDDRNKKNIWTPSNVITITRILLVPLFVAALLCPWPEWLGLANFNEEWKRWVAAGVFVFISGTDWLDGYLARRLGQVTDFGKFMDPLADKILVAAALIALVELGALPTWVVLIILAREFIVSGVRMMAATKGIVIAASWLGKSKTVFQMIAIVLFTLKETHADEPFSVAIADPFWTFSWVIMIIAIVLTIASLIDYLYKARDVIGLGQGALGTVDGDGCLPDDIETLATQLVERFTDDGRTLVTAESLTGGMIGSSITSVSGASAVFKGAVVSYTNEVKHVLLHVPQSVLDGDGAVSEACARHMADGARALLGSDIAVSVTGIAGPGGEEPGKPVGTVWIGISTPEASYATRYQFEGDREEVRLQTVAAAIKAVLDNS